MQGLLGMLGQFKKIQANLETTLQELADSRFTGEAAGGGVQVVLSGRKELLSLMIDPSKVDGKRLENVAKLILTATKEAFDLAEARRKERLEAAVGGLPIPPGLLNL